MTQDLASRVSKHNSGRVPSTRYRRPLELVYHERCATRIEARQREKYLKSGPGHAFIMSVISTLA
jgi:putative endonuclease